MIASYILGCVTGVTLLWLAGLTWYARFCARVQVANANRLSDQAQDAGRRIASLELRAKVISPKVAQA